VAQAINALSWFSDVRKNHKGADSTDRCNTIGSARAAGVLQMKYRTRIYYSKSQKALMWELWRKGESLQDIAQLFDRNRSSIQGSSGADWSLQLEQAGVPGENTSFTLTEKMEANL
jgi:hypothetical protein